MRNQKNMEEIRNQVSHFFFIYMIDSLMFDISVLIVNMCCMLHLLSNELGVDIKLLHFMLL